MFLIVTIKVIPQSSTQKWARHTSGLVLCYLKSAPENNKANDELISLLSKYLKCPRNNIMILSGATGRIKRLKIEAPITLEQFEAALGLERQNGIL